MILVAVVALGCNGGDDEHADELGPDCAAIAEVCHHAAEMEPDNAEAIECHDLGHAGDEAACTAEREACVASCEEITAGMEM